MQLPKLPQSLPGVLLIVDTLIRVAAVVTIPPNRRPTAAMAWLMAIFVAPIPGALLFSLFGSTNAREVLLDEWLERPVRTLVLDNLSRLTATVQ